MSVVLGCGRGGRGQIAPFAVGAWLVASILATPSGSLANPAISIAATVASGRATLSPMNALLFCSVQVLGALTALMLIGLVYAQERKSAQSLFNPDRANRASEGGVFEEGKLPPQVNSRV